MVQGKAIFYQPRPTWGQWPEIADVVAIGKMFNCRTIVARLLLQSRCCSRFKGKMYGVVKEKSEKEKYLRKVTVRFREQEYLLLEKQRAQTTCRKMSDYARRVLLREPVVVKYRNASADEFLAVISPLIDELNAIGKNFNQVVRKVYGLRNAYEVDQWLALFEIERQLVSSKTQEIKGVVNEMYERWLQK